MAAAEAGGRFGDFLSSASDPTAPSEGFLAYSGRDAVDLVCLCLLRPFKSPKSISLILLAATGDSSPLVAIPELGCLLLNSYSISSRFRRCTKSAVSLLSTRSDPSPPLTINFWPRSSNYALIASSRSIFCSFMPLPSHGIRCTLWWPVLVNNLALLRGTDVNGDCFEVRKFCRSSRPAPATGVVVLRRS